MCTKLARKMQETEETTPVILDLQDEGQTGKKDRSIINFPKWKMPLDRTIRNWLKLRKLRRLKDWKFSHIREQFIVNEYDKWESAYLPISVQGLRVLDVGAGEGETAMMFLNHGATHVICIEPDKKSFDMLLKNASRHDGKLTCINERFSLKNLKLPFDFMKVDIEGYEEILLNISLDKPSAMEVHGLQLRDKFAKKGFCIANGRGNDSDFDCLSYAYWLC
jgi:SAM-dependent methyltransferase